MITALDRVKAVATAAALEKITGARPGVVYYDDYAAVRWVDPIEEQRAREYVRQSMTAKPGPVRVDFAPVVAPEIARMYGGPLALAAVALFIIGRYSK